MDNIEQTFRVFISSTFRDMTTERNALHTIVYPKLQDFCLAHNCRFQFIDLRWGITEDAALNQQTVKICLTELERCQHISPRPNFIFILGDRYGSRPLPPEIMASEFDAILYSISGTQEEQNHARSLLTTWYREDKNATPPLYQLIPRENDYQKNDIWGPIEQQINYVFQNTVSRMNFDPKSSAKYLCSITEQEIIKGVFEVPDAKAHVFGFIRSTIASTTIQTDIKTSESLEDVVKLNNLKQRLREHLGSHVFDYLVESVESVESIKSVEPVESIKSVESIESIHENTSNSYVDQFCLDVYTSLERIIMEEIRKKENVKEIERELAHHENILLEKSKFFIGRNDSLQEIQQHIQTNMAEKLNKVIMVLGQGGVGKSAFLAKSIEKIRNMGVIILYRFLGTTPNSSTKFSLLTSICEELYLKLNFEGDKQSQIDELYIRKKTTTNQAEIIEIDSKIRQIIQDYAIPQQYDPLLLTYHRFLNFACQKKDIIVLLDALDQLEDLHSIADLNKIIENVPKNLSQIFSVRTEIYQKMVFNVIPCKIIELQRMNDTDANSLLHIWLQNVSRTLQDDQLSLILNKFRNNGLPLYLKIIFEEARQWKSYSSLKSVFIEDTVDGAIRSFFSRLSNNKNINPLLISRSLSYLVRSRNGLAETELIDILSLDEDVWADFIKGVYAEPLERKLPIIIWLRLFYEIEPFISFTGNQGLTLMKLYHREFESVVNDVYLKRASDNTILPEINTSLRKLDKNLATYFYNAPLFIGNPPISLNMHKLLDLVYTLRNAGMYKEIVSVLGDPYYIGAKRSVGLMDDLKSQYEYLSESKLVSGLTSDNQNYERISTLKLDTFNESKILGFPSALLKMPSTLQQSTPDYHEQKLISVIGYIIKSIEQESIKNRIQVSIFIEKIINSLPQSAQQLLIQTVQKSVFQEIQSLTHWTSHIIALKTINKVLKISVTSEVDRNGIISYLQKYFDNPEFRIQNAIGNAFKMLYTPLSTQLKSVLLSELLRIPPDDASPKAITKLVIVEKILNLIPPEDLQNLFNSSLVNSSLFNSLNSHIQNDQKRPLILRIILSHSSMIPPDQIQNVLNYFPIKKRQLEQLDKQSAELNAKHIIVKDEITKDEIGKCGMITEGNKNELECVFKLIVLGDVVGKTTIINVLTENVYHDSYIQTIGAQFAKYVLESQISNQKLIIKSFLWDFASSRMYEFMLDKFFKGVRAALLIYDLTNENSLESLEEYWISQVIKNKQPPFFALFGNKNDLEKERKISYEIAQEFADEIGAVCFLEGSAKTNTNIKEIFNLTITSYFS
jgi:small GTP-binding protein